MTEPINTCPEANCISCLEFEGMLYYSHTHDIGGFVVKYSIWRERDPRLIGQKTEVFTDEGYNTILTDPLVVFYEYLSLERVRQLLVLA